MSGNTIGRSFCVTTFGESHGPAIGAIVDGCPPGLELAESDIQADLEPRRTGTSQYTSQRQEPDRVRSSRASSRAARPGPRSASSSTTSMRARATTKRSRIASVPATPITLTSRNTESATIAAAAAPRRASRSRPSRPARLRASTCANGSASPSPDIFRRSARIASTCVDAGAARGNPFFCADPDKLPLLEVYIAATAARRRFSRRARHRARKWRAPGPRRADVRPARCRHRLCDDGHQRGQGRRDRRRSRWSRGSAARSIATNCAPTVSHRIIPAARSAASAPGQDLIVHVSFKPTSSIQVPGQTIDVHGRPAEIVTTGRHDPCVGLGPYRSSKRCSCSCSWTTCFGTGPSAPRSRSATPDITR